MLTRTAQPEAEMPPAGSPPRHVVITVHGTNSQHPDDDGERWWQKGSPFATELAAAFAKRSGPEIEILPLHWSGLNSDYGRLHGAAQLARTVRSLEKAGTPYSIIAHSHGGNVTLEALAQLPPSNLRGGVVTFGTPFFTRRLKTVPWLIALFQTVMGLVIAPIMIWYLLTTLGGDTNKVIETIVFFGGLLVFAAWSASRGLRTLLWRRRARRRCGRGIRPGQWLVIHSPRDEAMRLLETAAAISPQYVTVGAAMRSLTAFARLAGVVGTVLFFVATAGYFLTPIIEKLRAGTYGLAAAADLTFILLVPIVYGLIFGAVWLIARALGQDADGRHSRRRRRRGLRRRCGLCPERRRTLSALHQRAQRGAYRSRQPRRHRRRSDLRRRPQALFGGRRLRRARRRLCRSRRHVEAPERCPLPQRVYARLPRGRYRL